jgi:hypothetical protein
MNIQTVNLFELSSKSFASFHVFKKVGRRLKCAKLQFFPSFCMGVKLSHFCSMDCN